MQGGDLSPHHIPLSHFPAFIRLFFRHEYPNMLFLSCHSTCLSNNQHSSSIMILLTTDGFSSAFFFFCFFFFFLFFFLPIFKIPHFPLFLSLYYAPLLLILFLLSTGYPQVPTKILARER